MMLRGFASELELLNCYTDVIFSNVNVSAQTPSALHNIVSNAAKLIEYGGFNPG